MKYTILSLIILLSSNLIFSQDLKQIQLPRGARTNNTVIINGVTTHTYASGNKIPINGIPFLTKEFNNGVLELKDGKISNEVLLRYNIAKDQFEIKHYDDTLTINRPYDIKYIFLNNKKFIYDPHFLESEGARKRNGYLEMVQEGTLSLYLKRNKDLSYDSFVSTYKGGGGTKEYYYVDKLAYFGKTEGNAPFIIKSAKSFLNKLEAHKAEMKSFIKSNNIKFKKETDLIKLVNYYNTL